MTKRNLCLGLLLMSLQITAQENQFSLDLSNVKNTRDALTGINISSYYHFNQRLSGGIELNRFFSKKIVRRDIEVENNVEELELSAWDFDCNFHYNIPLTNHIIAYPILGFSHTSEKEKMLTQKKEYTQHFLSYNSGFGIMYSLGKIYPHIEYLFTWGKINQEFLLVGFSYELNIGHHNYKKKH